MFPPPTTRFSPTSLPILLASRHKPFDRRKDTFTFRISFPPGTTRRCGTGMVSSSARIGQIRMQPMRSCCGIGKRGAASVLDFLDAERSYRATQLAYRQALSSYMTALEQLKEAVGTRNLP